MKNLYMKIFFATVLVFAFDVLLAWNICKQAEQEETRQARIECIGSGLGNECNF